MTTFDFKTLVERFAPEIIEQRRIPRATYRMQFHKGFTFKDAEALVPYLDALGISDLYTSPILKAVPGSMHGYDICDPTQLNPELGTPEDFARLSEALQARGMGLLMDIVPNHMGIGSDCNAWWMDVLEKGPNSPYAGYFDIDWNPVKPELKDKVLLAILGDTYGNTLEGGQITLAYENGGFSLSYGERKLPIALEGYGNILRAPLDYLVLTLGDEHEVVRELRDILCMAEAGGKTDGQGGSAGVQERIDRLYKANTEAHKAIDEGVARFNGTTGDPASFDALDSLISMQHYRLAYWRVASEEINYRRFFDINTMAAIHIENPEVFAAAHGLIFDLVAKGQVMGLRIDHPDGLWNPPAYFRQLQENTVIHKIMARLNEPLSANQEAELAQAVTRWFDEQYRSNGKYEWPLYTVAEKILSETEPLPLEWAVDGTTGYDFMNLVNGLFVDNAAEARLSQIFADFTGRSGTVNRLEYVSKKMIMEEALASEINSLAHRLERLSEHNRHTRDFTLNLLLIGLREVIACLPIYRTYITGLDAVSSRDEQFVLEAVREAKRRNPHVDESVFDYVQDTLLLRNLRAFALDQRRDLIDFVMRVQQITPPVMAKSVEDTLFYVYNRLVSVNEVGGSPAAFGITWEDFARENVKRCRQWPDAMLATSTHDTKRSEDVRARLNVLSELADEWGEALETWSKINADYKIMVSAGPAPSANDEYLLYQTLLGTYPPGEPGDDYADRIVQYMGKATKEAKVYTSWTNPNPDYDQAIEQFVRAVLASDEFIQAFEPLARRVAFFGQCNSLSQTLLKLTCPGVPDTYRGTEVWDFSLVDPDNRRPVDYGQIQAMLESLKTGDRGALADDLMARREDGRIKLYVLQTALQFRRDYAGLFLSAPFEPLETQGAQRDHVCAFTRVQDGSGVLVIVPRLVAGLTEGREDAPIGDVWGDTTLVISDALVGAKVRNLFTDEVVVLGKETRIMEMLRRFPVGMFAIGE